MKYTITILVIFFCSCTSSGKLSDAKFPYKFNAITTGTNNVLITTSPQGLSGTTVIYNGSSTTPVSAAGSYSVKVSLTDRNYLGEKYRTKFNILKYLPYAAIALSILLAIFLFRRKRDETITLPDDDENYPPLDNAFGINNSIFKL